MGFRLSGQVLETVTGLTPAQKLILLGIAERADREGGNAFPSVDTLATYAECSPRNVELGLRRLRDLGWVTVQSPATNRMPTTYQLNRAKLDAARRGEESSPQTENPPAIPKDSDAGQARGEDSSPQGVATGGEVSSPQPEGRGEDSCTAGANFSAVRGEESSPDPILNRSLTDPKDTDTADADASVFALIEPDGDTESVLRTRFDRVWAVYPRGEKKNRAWQRFRKLAPSDAVVDVMVAKIEQQKRTIWGAVEPRFIPHLASWLEDQRWLDEDNISPVSDKELGEAHAWRGRIHMGRCPHTPPHTRDQDVDCLKAIALRTREQSHRRTA